jgi:heme A synthase
MFDPILARKWKNRIALLSLGTFIALFLGVFVSTTPGANQGCGVLGFPNSWPLCNSAVIENITDYEAQSQIIHRFVVSIVGLILLFTSYIIWKESKEDEYGSLICKWIWFATILYFFNMGLGGLYVLSAKIEGFEITYFELLSLIHLMIASLTFMIIATLLLAINVVTLYEKKYVTRDSSNQ